MFISGCERHILSAIGFRVRVSGLMSGLALLESTPGFFREPRINLSNSDSPIVLRVAILPLVPSTHHSHHLATLRCFIPGVKPSFSAKRSRRSLPFLLYDWFPGFPGLFTDTSEHIPFYFSVFLFPLFCFWFRVSFWEHVKIASRIV